MAGSEQREQPSGSPTETWTIDRVLRWVADDFRTRGIEAARLEAELLLAHTLGTSRIQLIMDRERPLTRDELTAYRGLISRRRRHEPIAYLCGQREFFGLMLRVDQRVLIPRPDTETLVEVALSRTGHWSLFGRMLDLCTGSGNVAIAVAHERPTWRVLGTDVSEDALGVARGNAMRTCDLWNLWFSAGDLYEAVGAESFELITANPPYIPEGEIAQLAADIREHEPRLALDGGSDGLVTLRRLVAGAPAHLVAGGVLAVEIAADQGPSVRGIFEQAGLLEVRVTADLGGRDRVVSGVWPG